MSDLIDRQQTLDALDSAAEKWNIAESFHEGIKTGLICAARIVLSLPSAEPETEQNVLNGDTIYRQQAIDALCDNCDNVKAVCAHYPCKQYIAIEQLPSAEPESDKRLGKIAELVEGTIDHFDKDDAMDLLYQIKDVINER